MESIVRSIKTNEVDFQGELGRGNVLRKNTDLIDE